MMFDPFPFSCTNRSLPAVYGDEKNYYQTVCELIYKVNELIKYVNDIHPEQFATKEELINAIMNLETKISEFIELNQAEQTVMLKAYFLSKLNTAVDQLEEEIKNTKLSNVLVIDPELSNTKRNIQDVLYLQNQNYRFFSDSAKHIDDLQYTVANISALDLTTYIFDFASTFYYSCGTLPIDGIYDGNYILSKIFEIAGGGGGLQGYVKKHDIMAYYFQQKKEG